MRRILYLVLWLTATVASAGAVPVTAKVVGPDGKPVAGAEVLIDDKMSIMGGGKSRTFKTDKAGQFSVNLEPIPQARGILGQAVVIAPGFALGGGILKAGSNTITLEPPRQVAGEVHDEKGQPVAGAVVRLMGVFSANPHAAEQRSLWLSPTLQKRFVVKADAKGHWVIKDMPSWGQAMIQLFDPAYARVSVQVPLGAAIAAAPPLVAKPGATIIGRVVLENGKPAPGVNLSTGWSEAVTATNGSYRLTGLSVGAIAIMVTKEPTGKLVSAPLHNIAVRAGETVRAPDLILSAGATVTGTVIDDATGKPMAGVAIVSQSQTQSTTDKQGRYTLRVAPGQFFVYPVGIPEGYLRQDEPAPLTIKKGETKTHHIRLAKGQTISGTALGTDGKPAVGATLRVGQPYENHSSTVGSDGQWSITGLKGKEAGLAVDGEWEIVQPKQVKLPAPGPVTVTLRRIKLNILTGRVKTPDGAPVTAATVKLQVETPGQAGHGNSWTEQDASTDEAGVFHSTALRPENNVTLRVEKSGYRQLSGGVVTKKDGTFEVTDVILAPLTGELRGVVVDAAGAPVAGARVIALEGEPDAPVTADATGRFALVSLPQGEVTAIAAHGLLSGRVRVQTGSPATISLSTLTSPPGQGIQRSYALLETARKEFAATPHAAQWQLHRLLAPRDPDFALKAVARPDRTVGDRELLEIISSLTEKDPARAVAWAPAHLATVKDQPSRLSATVSLALAAADTRPDYAREVLREATERLKATRSLEGKGAEYIKVATLAAKLKDSQTDTLLQMAVALADRTYSETSEPTFDEVLATYAATMAKASVTRAEQIAAEVPVKVKARAFARALPEITAANPAALPQLLPYLDKLDTSAPENREWEMWEVTRPGIEAAGKTQPAVSLALARKVQSKQYKPLALALAARFQTKEAAAKLYREASTAGGEYRSVGTLAQIAAQAYAVDAKLGQELFAQARDMVAAEKTNQWSRGQSVAEFAYYYARVDPAECRLMIEAEFARRSLGPDQGNEPYRLSSLARAMAAVDGERALEMAQAIPTGKDDTWTKTNALQKIAEYMLAAESERRMLLFNR